MLKSSHRKLHIIYQLFIFLFGLYVGQQLYLITQGTERKVRPSQTYLNFDTVTTKTIASSRQTNQKVSNIINSKTSTEAPSQISPYNYETDSLRKMETPANTDRKDLNTMNSKDIMTPSNPSLIKVNITLNKDYALKTLVQMNTEQNIRNIERFPLTLGEESVVMLVQVHSRVDDLKILVDSLRRVRYINESLVVFSHDLYSKPVFEVIQSIDFCPVLQLFYPYSIQFLDKRFPGDAPEDCPNNLTRTYVMLDGIYCYNADFYDSFGHYREGRVTQMKHHWLWKQHFVFDRIRVLRDYQGTVLRLDNDYYIAEDTIHVIRALNKVQEESCPECLMYILGDRESTTYNPRVFMTNAGAVEALRYHANVGRGMAFRPNFWRSFRSCARTFCHFDDYNWDWSLQRTSVDCMKGLFVLKPLAGRVYHIGACHGFHRNYEKCSNKIILSSVVSLLDKVSQFLYPKAMAVIKKDFFVSKQRNGYGGWSDPRDQLLCMKVFHNKTDDVNLLSEINKIISS